MQTYTSFLSNPQSKLFPYVEVCQLSIGTNVPKDPDQMSAHAQSNERTKNLELYSSAHFRLSMNEVIDWYNIRTIPRLCQGILKGIRHIHAEVLFYCIVKLFVNFYP